MIRSAARATGVDSLADVSVLIHPASQVARLITLEPDHRRLGAGAARLGSSCIRLQRLLQCPRGEVADHRRRVAPIGSTGATRSADHSDEEVEIVRAAVY